jgi:hypothetical protein
MKEVLIMLTINNIMKPQVEMENFYFISELGELMFIHCTDEKESREARKKFLRNYGNCRITKIRTFNDCISFEFQLPQCPCGDDTCPYFFRNGMSCICQCENPLDECDEFYEGE